MKNRQYTIRDVPPEVDRVLRRQARQHGKSLNTTLLETLKKGAGIADRPVKYRSLDWFYGSGGIGKDEEAAFKAQRVIDREAWQQ